MAKPAEQNCSYSCSICLVPDNPNTSWLHNWHSNAVNKLLFLDNNLNLISFTTYF